MHDIAARQLVQTALRRLPAPSADDEAAGSDRWWHRARCERSESEGFFAQHGDSATARIAKAICRQCPVRLECLQDAVDHHEPHGIWGGLTEKERRGRNGRDTLQVLREKRAREQRHLSAA